MGCPTTCKLADNLVFSVCTHDPDTGVLTDADAAPTYRVYEDETGGAILTGSMAKLDDANTTGFYSELIACTAGNGFEVGKTYTVYIEATVDSDKGGICYGFKIEAATPHVNVTEIEGSDPTDQINAAAAAALASYDPPTDAELDAALAALLAAMNDLSPAEAAAACDAALATYDAPTKAEMDAAFAALNDPTAAAIASAVWSGGTRALTDKDGFTLTAGERDSIAAALLDLANGIETGYTVRQTLRILGAVIAGKVSGYAAGPGVFRSLEDGADRATITHDAEGNRTAASHSA